MRALAESYAFWVPLLMLAGVLYMLPTMIAVIRGTEALALVILVNLIGAPAGIGWLAPHAEISSRPRERTTSPQLEFWIRSGRCARHRAGSRQKDRRDSLGPHISGSASVTIACVRPSRSARRATCRATCAGGSAAIRGAAARSARIWPSAWRSQRSRWLAAASVARSASGRVRLASIAARAAGPWPAKTPAGSVPAGAMTASGWPVSGASRWYAATAARSPAWSGSNATSTPADPRSAARWRAATWAGGEDGAAGGEARVTAAPGRGDGDGAERALGDDRPRAAGQRGPGLP